jgi:hypothetical protein
MANIVRDAHEVSTFFTRSGWKRCIINLKINRFPPIKLEKGADALSGTFGALEPNTTECPSVVRQIKKNGNTHWAKQPSARRQTRTIQKCVRHCLQCLTRAFAGALMLLMWLALPLADMQLQLQQARVAVKWSRRGTTTMPSERRTCAVC